jgi:hypothetical protein
VNFRETRYGNGEAATGYGLPNQIDGVMKSIGMAHPLSGVLRRITAKRE